MVVLSLHYLVPTLVPLLVAVIGAGGVVGSIAAYRKVQPEKDSIVVTAAQGALVIQAGVLDELRQELGRCHERIEDLTRELHEETARLRRERDAARAESRRLRERVRLLEERVGEIANDPDVAA
jgi:anaerobic glycerol-3-phosphate dehydrogenase